MGSLSRPHFIPQTAPESMETAEARAPESIVFRAERVDNRPKGQEKYTNRYLGLRCRRFKSGHSDQRLRDGCPGGVFLPISLFPAAQILTVYDAGFPLSSGSFPRRSPPSTVQSARTIFLPVMIPSHTTGKAESTQSESSTSDEKSANSETSKAKSSSGVGHSFSKASYTPSKKCPLLSSSQNKSKESHVSSSAENSK